MSNRTLGTENLYELPLLFIDLETTGTPQDGEIIEIGAIKLVAKTLAIIGTFESKIQITNPMGRSESELNFNGYNAYRVEDWHQALPLKSVLEKFSEFAQGCSPWAYNVSFEYGFLERDFQAAGLKLEVDYHWFDLMTLAREILGFEPDPPKTFSLSDIASHLGLAPEPKPHTALQGVRTEIAVYQELKGRLNRSFRTR